MSSPVQSPIPKTSSASNANRKSNIARKRTMTAATSTERAITRAPAWAWIIGTFFGTGLGRPRPGTWASVGTTLFWGGFARFAGPASLSIYAIVTAVAVTLIGIPAATRVARALGKGDPSQVVID